MTQYKEGNLIHVHVKLGETSTTIYGEVVGVDEDNMLEVYFLKKTQKHGGYGWEYKDDWDKCSPSDVVKCFDPTANYISVYHEFGFMPTEEENVFFRTEDEIPSNIVIPLPLDDPNDVHSDEYDMTDGFIVDDDEANEPFTHADPNNDFVRETHKAVNQYNNWTPSNNTEIGVKNFIDNMSNKYKIEDDDRHFSNGQSVDYDHPKV